MYLMEIFSLIQFFQVFCERYVLGWESYCVFQLPRYVGKAYNIGS